MALCSKLEIENVQAFVAAGRAVFTLVSRATSERFTYRAKASKDGGVLFVGLLTGPDNTASYSYVGYIRRSELEIGPFVHGGAKARASVSAPSVKAFAWFWSRVVLAQSPEASAQVEVYHEGHCGRCGRALTVPESIASGIGPECAKALGRAA